MEPAREDPPAAMARARGGTMMHGRHHFWGCGSSGEGRWEGGWQWEAAGAFGVRRPLRFLALRLGLDETQAREVARILDEVKTERAQAAVDHRRMSGALADVLSADAFDAN